MNARHAAAFECWNKHPRASPSSTDARWVLPTVIGLTYPPEPSSLNLFRTHPVAGTKLRLTRLTCKPRSIRMCRIGIHLQRAVSVAAAVVAVIYGYPNTCAGEDEQLTQYFRELRSRRLFSLAEGYCLERLGRSDVSVDARTTYTLELSRTLAEHAKFAVGDEQAELWKQAVVVIEDLLKSEPKLAKRQLLLVQQAFIAAAQGEHLRWQAELFPEDEELLKRTLKVLESSAGSLRSLQLQLEQEIRSGAYQADGISPFELRQLEQNTRYRLGTTLLDQAKLLPPNNPNRIAGLIDANVYLRRLAGGVASETLTQNSQLLHAECLRLQGDYPRARSSLAKLERETLTPAIEERVTAEHARILFDELNPLEANRKLIEFYDRRKVLSGETYLLKVRIVARLWESALDNDPKLADEWWKQLEAYTEQAEKLIGGYWGQRCRYLMDFVAEAKRFGPELARTIRSAKSLYAAGNTSKAVERYGEAARMAFAAKRIDFATEFAFTRASLQVQTGEFTDAGREFRDLYDRFPNCQEASRSHLLWGYCLGKRYEVDLSTENREAYTAALEQHRELFPNEPTAAEAAWMLARLEERRQQTTKALKFYLLVPGDHRRGPDAQVSAARCYERILERLVELDRSTMQWRLDATTRLGRMVSLIPPEPANLDDQQAELLVRLARIHLGNTRPVFSLVDRYLQHVFGTWARIKTTKGISGTDVESRWQTIIRSATPLRVISLAGQGHNREAVGLVEKLAENSTDEVFAVLHGLGQVAARSPVDVRRELGEVRLQAIASLKSRESTLSKSDRLQLLRCHADALLATNQPKAAIQVYESLLKSAPNDRKLMAQVAELLVTVGTEDAWQKARTHWRTLESLEQSGSRRWLELRWEVARCTYEVGDYAAAHKTLELTSLLHPKLGGDDLKKKYVELKAKAAAKLK